MLSVKTNEIEWIRAAMEGVPKTPPSMKYGPPLDEKAMMALAEAHNRKQRL